MKCTLRLYLKSVYFISKEIELSDDVEGTYFEYNFKIRESQLKSAVEVFRIENYKQIIKMQYDYDITATFQSAMKQHSPSNDFLK